MNFVDSTSVRTGFPGKKKISTNIVNCSSKLLKILGHLPPVFSANMGKPKGFSDIFRGKLGGRCSIVFIVDFEYKFRTSVLNV